MSLAVCVFVTWIVIIILALIPKKLSDREMIFLFFINTICELSTFTLIHLNLHLMAITKSVENAFADLVMRLVFNPLMLVIAANVLCYSSRFWKYGIIAVVGLIGVMLQKLLQGLGVLTTPHWNAGYTFLLFCGYASFTAFMTWFITHVDRGKGKLT